MVRALFAIGMLISFAPGAAAREWFVAPGGSGSGTHQAPFGSVQAALAAAQPGDRVIVRPGTYRESVRTVRSGAAGAPITLRSEHPQQHAVIISPGSAAVSGFGRAESVLRIAHSFIVIEDLVFDGAYARRTAITVSAGTQSVILRRAEVRRSGRDCVDIGAALDVLIEDSIVHHCLNPAGGRTDAHGIVAGAVRRLTIRGAEIHTFSGDAIQLNRTGTATAPGWDDVLIERCRLWLAPLPADENGFRAGTVPGENALDTKVAATSPRARITIRDTQAWGFRGGLIRLQAAFNLKENIDATVDRVTVRDSEIAFRLRGSTRDQTGAWVRIQNAVLHDVSVGIRYEDDIQRLRVWNTTFGRGIGRPFVDASTRAALDVRNVAIVGAELPAEAARGSNLAVSDEAFANAASHDYRPSARSPLTDAGAAIAEVAVDRAGIARPQGRAQDVGAYERR